MNKDMLNTGRMTKNIQTERMGVVPQVDVTGDLLPKPKVDNNSWFAFGRFEGKDHILNYLFHVMELKLPFGTKYQVVLTIFDEVTGDYYAKDFIFKARDMEVHDKDFFIKAPNALMSGTWNEMKIQFKEKDIRLDIVATAIHYPIITRGSSCFEVLNMTIYQYSVPFMRTAGTFAYKGKTYDITDKGYTWFDRQWQQMGRKPTMNWSWMAIQLDNGEVISVFDCGVPDSETTFASILHPDGSQTNMSDLPAFKKEQLAYWYSEKSKQNYPVHWMIELPPANAKLEITPIIKEQEIVSVMKQLHKYEGVCHVKGTYKGAPVTGHALVELIGIWPK